MIYNGGINLAMPQSFFKENRGVVGKGRVEGESSYFVLIVITTKIHAVTSYTCTAREQFVSKNRKSIN